LRPGSETVNRCVGRILHLIFHRPCVELFASVSVWDSRERFLAGDRNPALFVVAGFPVIRKGNALA